MFGQSAGAGSLDYYSLAYYNDDPIINGFIQESGNGLNPIQSAATAKQDWYEVTANLGCGNAASADQAAVLACMRALPDTTILQSLTTTSASFGPAVDGVRVFDNNTERIAAGQLIQRPILLGNNDDEGGFLQPAVQGELGVPLPQALLDLLALMDFTCPEQTAAQLRLDNNIPTW